MAKTGSLLGGMLLITGSCIGAGMLGLPILTGMAGFFPSMIAFFIAWIFMTTTALYLIEVNCWFKRPVNLITMVSETLGPIGKIVCWILYLFLFYALLVAYTSGSGNHVANFFREQGYPIPDAVGSLFFVLLFGWFVYLGTKPVDHLNRWLMLGKIIAYLALVFLGISFVQKSKLFYTDSKYTLFALPVLIISFGFHNMIPSLTHYFGHDIKRTRIAILGGSVFALVIYLIWEIIALGILPIDGADGIFQSYKKDIDAAQALHNFIGKSAIATFAQLLAFFAILTSFLAQSLSIVHFLRDGMKLPKKKRENIGLCALALAPPLILSIIYPQLFFQALNFGGGICAVILFGIMPAIMVWSGRYIKNVPSCHRVYGGKPLIICIFTFACFILFYQITQTLNLGIFPTP